VVVLERSFGAMPAAKLPLEAALNRKPASRDDSLQRQSSRRSGHMTIDRAIALWILVSGLATVGAGPALAQACSRQGNEVTCDDGRRGLLSGDAILWPDGTRSSLSPHPSVVIGNKSSVRVGPGVFVGQGKGAVPLDDPNAPNKTRCAVLDGASYCY
jgi:hypothetical protein